MLRKLIIITILLPLGISSQWVQLNSGTTYILTDVCFPDQNTGYISGFSSTILKTTNGGINWANISNPSFVNLLAIYFNDPLTGIAVGESGRAVKTTNGGSSWVVLTSTLNDNLGTIYMTDNSIAYIGAVGGKIIKTTDGGANWSLLSTGTTQEVIKIHFVNANMGFAGCSSGLIIKSTNGGNNWSQLNTGITQHIYGIFACSIDTIYASCDFGRVIKSINGGTSWLQQTSGTTERLCKIFFTNELSGSSVGLNSTIIRTTNGGNSWITQQSGVSGIGLWSLWFTSTLTGYACGDNGTILKTTTGGFPYPSQPVLVAPQNGANGISITPTLDWDSVTTAESYNIQVATDSNFSNTIIDTSQIVNAQMNVPPGRLLNNTFYFWRVRGVNIVGYGPFSVIFRFRTIVAFPAPPVLLLPVNNASNVSLTPTFDWDSNSVANYYTLQASLDTSFTNPQVNVTGITQSFYTISTPQLQYNSRYYWRVSTTNNAGTSPWSVVFRFTTIFGPPSPPTLLSPPDGTVGVSLRPTMRWVEDISALNYKLQISSDSTFAATPEIDTTVADSSQVTIKPGVLVNVHQYFWRVRTTNPVGTSGWSSTWRFFTLLSAPSAPVLISPPNNAINVNLTPTLDWDTVQYSQSFRIQLANDSLFTTGSMLINVGSLPVSQYNVPGATLTNNTLYYWRVSASNAAGTGPFSAVWKFRTVISPPVAAPNLISPPNGSFNQTLTPVLDWNDVFGSQGYQLLVTSDSLFNSIVLDTTITPSQFTIPLGVLQITTTYYWKVRGFNTGGFGPFSVSWHFTTGVIGITQISSNIPKEFKLHNNFPNPFNPVTKIRFDVPTTKSSLFNQNGIKILLEIYDVLGRKVAEPVDSYLEPGYYETVWNADNVSSGIYFYRIVTQEYIAVKKMVLLK